MEKWIKPHLRELKPYASARSLGDIPAAIWLDANENRYGNALQKETWSRYPSYTPVLREQYAQYVGVRPEQLLLTHGSDEAIDLIFKLFCDTNDVACGFSPTYGMYAVTSHLYGCEWLTLSLTTDFNIPAHLHWPPQAKVLFICRPNNPTGNSFSLAQIRRMLDTFPGLVVVDEAYQEFSDQPSATTLLAAYPQLMVLRTLSKAFGLAGLRLGALIAAPEAILWFRKIQAPYPLSVPSLEAGEMALRHKEWMLQQVEKIKAERKLVSDQLNTLPGVLRVFPSETNFVLFQIKNPSEFVAFARNKGLLVRDRSQETNSEGCVRVTIGKPEDNRFFLQTITEFLQL